MTADLILGSGVALIAIGSLLTGVACADRLRGIWWALADRWRSLRGPAPVYVPVGHPRYGALVQTPSEGAGFTLDDGEAVVYQPEPVRADLPVQRKETTDHAPTGPFQAVPYTPEPASWADPPPTLAELRRQYDSWQETVYGERPQLEVAPEMASRGPIAP